MPVDTMTPNEPGEIPVLIDMNADEAREITEAIKAAVEQLWALVVNAYNRRAWLALNYPTWDDYCAKEFRTAALAVPREERPEVVRSLREAGLSQRAIASAMGVSQSTVRDDIAELSSNYSVPCPTRRLASTARNAPHTGPNLMCRNRPSLMCRNRSRSQWNPTRHRRGHLPSPHLSTRAG